MHRRIRTRADLSTHSFCPSCTKYAFQLVCLHVTWDRLSLCSLKRTTILSCSLSWFSLITSGTHYTALLALASIAYAPATDHQSAWLLKFCFSTLPIISADMLISIFLSCHYRPSFHWMRLHRWITCDPLIKDSYDDMNSLLVFPF